MKFSSKEEFELHVHKCFGKIFENLSRMDSAVKKEAERLEAEGEYGVMSDLRDWVEDTILYCHLAWQYHRLSRAGGSSKSTWEDVDKVPDPAEGLRDDPGAE